MSPHKGSLGLGNITLNHPEKGHGKRVNNIEVVKFPDLGKSHLSLPKRHDFESMIFRISSVVCYSFLEVERPIDVLRSPNQGATKMENLPPPWVGRVPGPRATSQSWTSAGGS